MAGECDTDDYFGVAANLMEMRLEHALAAFIGGQGSLGSSEAAQIAGIPRVEFLQILVDRGISMFHGPWSLAAELESMAQYLGDEELAAVAAVLKQRASE